MTCNLESLALNDDEVSSTRIGLCLTEGVIPIDCQGIYLFIFLKASMATTGIDTAMHYRKNKCNGILPGCIVCYTLAHPASGYKHVSIWFSYCNRISSHSHIWLCFP